MTRAISISKTRKITANKKNRVEKGMRADLLGSNPHSKGELFSRSIEVRIERIKPIRSTTKEINKLKVKQ